LDDFYNTFHLGVSDGYNIQDLAGVAIASIKELNQRFINQNQQQATLDDQLTQETNQNIASIQQMQNFFGTQFTQQLATSTLTVDTLVANNIQANHIEGLDVIQAGIADVQTTLASDGVQIENIGQQVTDVQTALAAITTKTNSLTVDANGNLTAMAGLTVGGPVQFQGPAMFKALAEFVDKVVFHNDVEFDGHATFNQDTAGYAIVKTGNDNVVVTFAQEYAQPPVVNASVSLQQIQNDEVRKASEDLLLITNANYIITNVTTTGFEIKVAQKALSDIPFSWTAIAVKDAKTFEAADAVSTASASDQTDKTDTTDTADSSANAAAPVTTVPTTTPSNAIAPTSTPDTTAANATDGSATASTATTTPAPTTN